MPGDDDYFVRAAPRGPAPPSSSPWAASTRVAPPRAPSPAARQQVLPPFTADPTASGRRWTGLALTVLLVVSSVVLTTLRAHGDLAVGSPLHAVPGVSSTPWAPEFRDADGHPARWDPCHPVHYVVNPSGAPSGGVDDLRRVLDRVTAAAGITFVSDGFTDEVATLGRSPYQPGRYGDRWAPMLVMWSSRAGTDLLTESSAEGVTVPVALGGHGGGSIVSAEVVLNADRLLPTGFGPGPSDGEVLMHELGHAVGLGHVDDRNDAMYPTVRGVSSYGPGDLQGFAALGLEAGCHPAPAPRRLQVVAPVTG